MTQDVHSALATNFERYEIREQLHDVPPHAVYEVRVDGRRAVCKVARGDTADPETEAAVIHHVDRHTDLPVPSVLAAGEGYFVASWLDGLPADDEVPSPDETDAAYARALGSSLARLHDATAGTFVRPGFPRADSGDGDPLAVDARDRWVGVVQGLLDEFEAYLVDTEWVDPVREVRTLVEDYPDLFAGAGDPVLCHGNALPDHVGFGTDASGDPTDIAALVDFEHALVAPGEYDLWRTAIPVFGRPGADAPRPALSAFRAGYESVRPLPDGFERRRDGYRLVNLASYFVALDVQNGGIGPDERPQADGMADVVSETVGSIRDRRV
ncbi:phosphotransferase [Halosimplex amylolyticum]|uniref:phosphotransferase n=1 Tax=Halosimplex amylolyticum TaxID=3396616 RepID=UPI003F5747B5